MDNFAVFKYLIIIELILLFVIGYFGGKNGLIITVIVSTLLFTWLLFATSALSGAYTNSNIRPHLNSDHIKQIFIVFLTFAYIAGGVYLFVLFLKREEPLTVYFYIWLITIVGTITSINVLLYKNDPVRIETLATQKIIKQRQLEKDTREKEFEEYIKSTAKLLSQFEKAMTNTKEINNYINLSERVSKQYNDSYSLPTIFANYTTKLMICSIGNGELEIARYLFDSYIDSIITHTGLSEKSSDVAGNAIVLSILSTDENIYERVEAFILGKNFQIEEISNPILLFNLACNFSLKRDKKELLLATAQSLKYGKSSDQFLKDSDFSYYLDDEDFLSLLDLGVRDE